MLSLEKQYCDRPHRFWSAIDNAGLNSDEAYAWNIGRAIDDCVYAGINPATCPAIKLLKHKRQQKFSDCAEMARLNENEIAKLKEQCETKLEKILQTKYLPIIGLRDLSKNAEDKRRFHSQARKALTALADALTLENNGWKIQQPYSYEFEQGITRLVTSDLIIDVTAGQQKGANVIVRKRTSEFFEDCKKILIQTLDQLSETKKFAETIQQITLEKQAISIAESYNEIAV
jgi:hypothetical protein